MIHQMKLWDESFKSIKDGYKTIEMRLNDEKRSIIQTGDIIEFTNTLTGEELRCIVINLYRYDDFEKLYKNHSKKSIGYKENEVANSDDMLEYYSIDNIQKYGVLGIEIRILL